VLQLASSGASKPEAGPTPLHSRAKWLFRRHRTPRRPSTRPRVDTRTEREIESKVAWPREPEAGTLTACPPARGTCPAARGDGTKRAAGVTKGPPTDRPTTQNSHSLSRPQRLELVSWCIESRARGRRPSKLPTESLSLHAATRPGGARPTDSRPELSSTSRRHRLRPSGVT